MPRLAITIKGAVQGVGFRPFVYQLATALDLRGWVSNSAQGVEIEIAGPDDRLAEFLHRLQSEHPPHAWIQSLETRPLADLTPAGDISEAKGPRSGLSVNPSRQSPADPGFTIRPSQTGIKTALMLPDLATCPACLRELFDPHDRRYRYPFINCTHCGPRFSIIAGLPYDRAQTTMRAFTQCPQCQAEYDNPGDRRFHAQPNACPACGPQLAWWDRTGTVLAQGEAALQAAVSAIRQGAIVAIKGLGGFHLVVDAQQPEAIHRLRYRKQRPDKPFALMYPSLAAIQRDCEVSPLEARLLQSAQAPIVLLRRRGGRAQETDAIAPGNPYWGIMLPYTPLHHLLMADLQRPVVATSGNRSSEPICFEEKEAVARLGDLADYFLVHDRPILRPVDDAIVRVVAERELVLRRARGYAPLPIQNTIPASSQWGQDTPVPVDQPATMGLALGADLKNTVALALGSQVFLSQHLGDLHNSATLTSQQQAIATLRQLYDAQLAWIACDLHPDYVSTHVAQQSVQPGQPLIRVQHHHAHIAACLAENQLMGPVLGVAWDGTGYGPDGTIWGGEFLIADRATYQRVAHLRSFGLPGGEAAVREPRRSAIGLLYELWGDAVFERDDLAPLRSFSPQEQILLRRMLQTGFNTPRTTSMGRLFDAVAALLDLCQIATFEGQAAMAVEFAQGTVAKIEPYLGWEQLREAGKRKKEKGKSAGDAPVGILEQLKWVDPAATMSPQVTMGGGESRWVVDWEPWIEGILADLQQGRPIVEIAARFHATLAATIVAVAARVGMPAVALSGGCFQNRVLTEQAIAGLQQAGFQPYWHRQIPPNDGGIALGQAIVSMAQFSKSIP
ncbi:carbamoyltransferase HypF [Trichothermofontia sichuanensis B231]|uniref:carbamoyltransferase HypF n=1 Tax=Trichothermofontia sichuanensis TaxID=3045816 RepID=UPI0022458929|nr:carbamoyltransferase HypF [Trichothermofontia sichuanensis]UZQ56062.1 carbamoyltransferase HypF [Trichothermofontia sichuanensis B231]